MLLRDRGTGARLGQEAVAWRLASLGLEFSEEAVEPVTGYRVDILLHGGDGGATGRCAVEVGIYSFIVLLVAQHYHHYLLSLSSLSQHSTSSSSLSL